MIECAHSSSGKILECYLLFMKEDIKAALFLATLYVRTIVTFYVYYVCDNPSRNSPLKLSSCLLQNIQYSSVLICIPKKFHFLL